MNQIRQVIKETINDYVENKENSIQFLVNEMIEELSFQKNFLLTNLQLKESFTNKLSYVEVYQKKMVKGLYGGNSIIMEDYSQNFKKRVIVESIYDFESEINKFNKFITDSVLKISGVLSEQGALGVMTPSSMLSVDAAKSLLADAVSYLKKYGITQIMEGLRNALLSGVGAAIQIALSFTGVGAIANDIAWGIMTLYDAYQLFVNNAPGSIANLIIDLICLLTAGTLGKSLKGFVNFGGTTIEMVLNNFMKSGVGKFIEPILGKIQGGMASLSSVLGEASAFMKNKMGISWVANLLSKVTGFFVKMSIKLGTFLGKGVAKVASPLIRAGAELGAKLEIGIFNELSKKTEQELSKMAGKSITKSQLKAAEKYSEDYLQEKPTEQALTLLDKRFGTGIAKLYSTYISAKKLQSSQSKLAKGITSVDVGVDALKGKATINKSKNLASKIQNNLSPEPKLST